MAHELTHEPDVRRYTLRVDDELACFVDYVVNGDAIVLTSTYTEPTHRGHGYAAEIVEFAVNDIETTTDYRIASTCSYVTYWFDLHPERAALLTR